MTLSQDSTGHFRRVYEEAKALAAIEIDRAANTLARRVARRTSGRFNTLKNVAKIANHTAVAGPIYNP
eukprot:SAG25_NODE_9607_length_365_cov_1.526316_2_plen_67_part_01